MAIRARLMVTGSIQGVGFRWFVQRCAKECQITGWVKNLPDGDVEIACEAETEKNYRDFLDKVESKKYTGPALGDAIDVDKIQVVEFEKDTEPKHDHFGIEY